MVSMPKIVGSAVASLLFVLASCATPRAPSRPEGVTEMCHASCTRRAACSQRVDESACEVDCRDNGSKWRPYWRPDYVSAVTQCLDALPCSAAKDSKSRLDVCFASTKPLPSPTAQRFAALAVRQDQACHVYYDDPRTVAQREQTYATLDDRVLEQMITCQERGCEGRHDTRWACVYDLVGIKNDY